MTNASARAHEGRDARGGSRLAILLFGVCLAVVVTHWPALSARAVSFDDRAYVLENDRVKNPSWDSVGRFFGEVSKPSTVKGYYHPLSMTSLMLDTAMGGSPENFGPFHRTSLALHVLNVALIVVLLYQLFGNALIAALVALLFGVHPMTVEPIPWLGERKTLLAAFFALATLVLWVRWVKTRSRAAYAGSLALFALALLSKPTTVFLTPALWILDAWPFARFGWRTLLESLPFAALSGVFAVITIVSQRNAAGVYLPTDDPWWQPPLMLLHNVVFYPRKLIWPTNLSSYYAFPHPFDLTNPAILAGVIGTPLLLGALALSLRWTRAFAAGWLMFFVVIFPTMGLIGFTGVIASDKYAYLPAIGILMTLAWLLARAWRRGRRAQVAVVAVALGLATTEALAARRYHAVFRDTETLFNHMLALDPTESLVHAELANELSRKGQTEKAIAHWKAAIYWWPKNAVAHFNLGVELEHQGKIDEALEHYTLAASAEPENLSAHFNAGVLFALKGRLKDAEGEFREVLRIDPHHRDALTNLDQVLAKRAELQKKP